MNRNWLRWIKSSTAKHFFDRLKTNNLFCFIEGSDRRTATHQQYAEFRIDGPYAKEINANYWQLDVEINLLVVTNRDDQDLYGHERGVGFVCETFTPGIPVWKYGDSPTDLLGCLKLIPDNREKIIVSNFGQVNVDSRMLQSTVEAHYRLNLTD